MKSTNISISNLTTKNPKKNSTLTGAFFDFLKLFNQMRPQCRQCNFIVQWKQTAIFKHNLC